MDHPGNSATLAKRRAVGGNNDLPDFKHAELEVSSRNLVASVQQAAVTGGDRGLTRTRGTDGKFIRVAVRAGEQTHHSAVPSWHPAQPGAGRPSLLSSATLERVHTDCRGPSPEAGRQHGSAEEEERECSSGSNIGFSCYQN